MNYIDYKYYCDCEKKITHNENPNRTIKKLKTLIYNDLSNCKFVEKCNKCEFHFDEKNFFFYPNSDKRPKCNFYKEFVYDTRKLSIIEKQKEKQKEKQNDDKKGINKNVNVKDQLREKIQIFLLNQSYHIFQEIEILAKKLNLKVYKPKLFNCNILIYLQYLTNRL